MSAEKYTPKLGALIETDEPRDAIHIAVAPVVAAEWLTPGMHVGLGPDGRAYKTVEHIGVVDPYLKDAVFPGNKFWLFLYPNTITALRHEWVHPAFGAIPAAAPLTTADAARAHLEAIADANGVSLTRVLDGAASLIEGDEYPIHLSWGITGVGDAAEFWRCYALVTGNKVPAEIAGRGYVQLFSCSC